ncbi:MAG: hypothetical protein AB7L90_04780 [Hyphomicrobiaceae bacterium]
MLSAAIIAAAGVAEAATGVVAAEAVDRTTRHQDHAEAVAVDRRVLIVAVAVADRTPIKDAGRAAGGMDRASTAATTMVHGFIEVEAIAGRERADRGVAVAIVPGTITVRDRDSGPGTCGAMAVTTRGAVCRSGFTAAITMVIAIGSIAAPSRPAARTGGIAMILADTTIGDHTL